MRTTLMASLRRELVRIALILLCTLVGVVSGREWEPEQETLSFGRVAPPSAVVQLVAVGPATDGKDEECTGTGFFVNDKGAILTNAHVVEEARRCLEAAPGAKILAKFAGPDPNNAEAISCDEVGVDDSHDLAVLKAERPPDSFRDGAPRETGREVGDVHLTLDPGEVPVGTQVYVTGHTGRTWHAVTLGGHIIARKSLILWEPNAEPSEVMVLDIPLKRGASGSPVYLHDGRAIGVVVETDPQNPDHTVAVRSSYAIRLLDRLHVPYRSPSASKD
jgi:S1-C subfamily serine protease